MNHSIDFLFNNPNSAVTMSRGLLKDPHFGQVTIGYPEGLHGPLWVVQRIWAPSSVFQLFKAPTPPHFG